MNTSPVHVCYHSLSVTIALDKPGFPELTVSRDGIPYFRLQTGMVFDRPTTNLRTTPSLIEHTFTLSLETPHYTKRSHCTLEIHEATLDFGELVLHLHLSDQGFAYRWQTRFDYATTILDETFDLTLLGHPSCLYAHHNLPHCDDPFQNSWESVHHFTPLKAITPRKLIYLPITFCYPSAAMSFTEAELIDYPGLNLQKTPHHPQFTSLLARAAKHVDASNRRNAFVLERHAYLVQTNGRRYFPWRICMMADAVAKLYENDLPYLLSHPAEEDFKWVRPGRVAWEWWNAWGLEKVAFTPGVNTATYKVYIDFAHTFNLPYVILDEGWAQQLDITKIIPEIDLPELIRYAAQRHVQLILWASWPQLIDC
ncbi:MAG: glycoside hydrolase family 97 catalytic domain-containing protein, partial [Kiritimatiellae bacterium]|nr:glycoside hydrolase family 97 catalytic domain-containing protein [Kiritimatiellia bacterium]